MTSGPPQIGSSCAECRITAGKYLPIQRLHIPAPLADRCGHVTCSHQLKVSSSGVHFLQYKVGNRQVCLPHPLFYQQNREDSETQEEGRDTRQKEAESLSDFMEGCPFTKVFSSARNTFLVGEAPEISGNFGYSS